MRTRKRRHARKTRRRQKGGQQNLQEIASLLDTYFDTQWILTGSQAVRMYLDVLGLALEYTLPPPADLDVLVVSPREFRDKRIGPFQRLQDLPMRSMTFQHPAPTSFPSSLDILVDRIPRTYYVVEYEGRPYRLHAPQGLQQIYASELATRPADRIKLNALDTILAHLDSLTDGPHVLRMSSRPNMSSPYRPQKFPRTNRRVRMLQFNDSNENDESNNVVSLAAA